MVVKMFKTFCVRKLFLKVKAFYTNDIIVSTFFVLFILGYIAGCFLQLYQFATIETISANLSDFLYKTMPDLSFAKIFIEWVKIFGVILMVEFCLGMFVPGQVLLTVFVLFESILTGIAAYGLIEVYRTQGFFLFIVIILPALLIFLNFQFIMLRRAFELSLMIFRAVFYKSDTCIYKKYKGFIMYFGVMIVVALGCSTITAAGYTVFGRMLK